MKLLIFDTNYISGVNRESILIKIRYWQTKKASVSILCTEEGKNFYSIELKNIDYLIIPFKYEIRSFYFLPWQYIKVNCKALRIITCLIGKYDIVYSLSGAIDFIFIPYIWKIIDKKIRWFAVVDNIVPRPSERPGKFLLKLLPYLAFLFGNQLLKKCDGIFVVTDFLKNYYGKRDVRVYKTGNGNGIDINIFKGKITNNTPFMDILYAGRFHIAKGIFDLIEVVNYIVKIKPELKVGLMGIGDNETIGKMKQKIREYSLEKNIIFLGYKHRKKKGDIYRNCGLFLFLSYAEGCPQVVAEALAANKPIVTYDLPTYHDVFAKFIENGQIALFKKGDIIGISEKIINSTLNNKRFSNKLENFSWKKILDKEWKIFQDVI